MLLTREQILSAADQSTEEVEVPEWGGTVRVRTISGDERDTFDLYRDKAQKKGAVIGFKAFLVAMAACDAEGNPLFKPEDVVELGKKSDSALNRVFDVACRLNGLGAAAEEEIEKN